MLLLTNCEVQGASNAGGASDFGSRCVLTGSTSSLVRVCKYRLRCRATDRDHPYELQVMMGNREIAENHGGADDMGRCLCHISCKNRQDAILRQAHVETLEL